MVKYILIFFAILVSCESSTEAENDIIKDTWFEDITLSQKPNGIELHNGSDRKISYSYILKSNFDSLKHTFVGIPPDSLGIMGSLASANAVILNRYYKPLDSVSFIYWDKDYADPSEIPRIDFRLF